MSYDNFLSLNIVDQYNVIQKLAKDTYWDGMQNMYDYNVSHGLSIEYNDWEAYVY